MCQLVDTICAKSCAIADQKFCGAFSLFDFALANGCRKADKKRGDPFFAQLTSPRQIPI